VASEEAADDVEIAVQAFGLDKFANPFQGVMAFLDDIVGQFISHFATKVTELRFDRRGDLPAIAAAATAAYGVCLDDHRVPPAACGLDRRAKPGIAGADDHHIGAGGQGGFWFSAKWAALPPKGLRLVGGGK